ncbi:CYTH and CHAD domain-containing protein [Mycolicibacterium stellerae]|uniref:CYTH and CHAD domain-containing protein n=1 Tax=Mycolicibacterium stellerae TaxID=2358193 RepID=UPI000F0BB72D|nr:CYTH and CHAD domain-containing protein [Mycolicibacterium stellerae]
MHELLEREEKWDVDDHFVVPDLHDLIDGGDVDLSTVHLESVYYDTSDHDLQSHGIVLRRRDGDDDTGWQLKVPDPEGRIEIRTSLADDPPTELKELLTGLRLGKPLVNVATVRTDRTRYRIRADPEDGVIAELADDLVRASVDHRLLAWREVEVELGPDARPLARRLTKRLTKAGARPSRYPSKLAHAIAAPRRPDVDGDGPSALAAYVSEQIDAIFEGDIALRRGQDPIHDTRVAIRRLRSTIRVFGKLLDRTAAGHVDEELKWFAGLLGEVRDRQVQRRRFRKVLADWPPEIVLGPVANRINTDLHSEQLRARKQVAEAMDSPRYLDILATLQQWRAQVPVTTAPSAVTLRKRAARAEQKADRRLEAAADSDDDALLHRARKAAKRARYAAELRRQVDGSSAVKKAEKHYKRIQRVLGEHQDSVVASDALRRFALTAGTSYGENGFTYGLLYAREQQIAQAARDQARELLR